MDKSDCFYRRKYLMDTLNLPTLNEVKGRLGSNLSKLFEERVPKNLKPEFGLSIELGTGRYVWNSPSDLLVGKVCLKPPITDKYIKALTHLSIFDLGRMIEKKFWNEAELQKQKELAEQEEILKFICEAEKKEVEKRVRAEEYLKCEAEKRQMEIEFQEELLRQLQMLEERLLHEYQQLMDDEIECVNEKWQILMDQEIENTVQSLNAKWTAVLNEQRILLYEEYNFKLLEEHKKCRLALKAERECFTENFRHLKHQLQCKNIANIMYVLCTERHRCQMERERLQKRCVDHIQDLLLQVTEKDIKLETLKQQLSTKSQQLYIREQCLKEVLREFQKFINYVLRASPTQAEFLLTLENLICAQIHKEEEAGEFQEDPVEYCHCYTVKERYKEEPEIPPKRYSIIREDFQKIVTQEVKLCVSDMVVHQTNEKSPTEEPKSGYDITSTQSSASKVHFNKRHKNQATPTQESSKTSVESSKRSSLKSSKKYGSNIDYMALHELDHRFPLIGTKNSLELQKEELKFANDSEKVNEVLMVIKDSLIKHRNSLKSNSSVTNAQNGLGLEIPSQSSINVDKAPHKKMEVIESTMASTGAQMGKVDVSSEMLVKESKISMHVDSLELIQEKPAERSTSHAVQVSRIQATIDEKNRLSTSVNFKLEPVVLPENYTDGKVPISASQDRDNFLTVENVLQVVGDQEATEHLQTEEDFACYRTQSLIRILRRHPSITRLFTSCGR